MVKIAICTAFYEGARPYLSDFFVGVKGACREHDVTLMVVNDGLIGVEATLFDVLDRCKVQLVTVREKMTPARVRGRMLAEVCQIGADVLIFADADDILNPEAVERHLLALEDATFSYGDVELLDATGMRLGRRFFENARVPVQCRDTAQIVTRNYLGFSNTAIRRQALSVGAVSVPDNISCADWWFFTKLVAAGWHGRQTLEPVAGYRLHGGNILGAGPPRSARQVRTQADMLFSHLNGLADLPSVALQFESLLPGFAWLEEAADREVEATLVSLVNTPGVWFEHVSKLLAEKSKSDPAMETA